MTSQPRVRRNTRRLAAGTAALLAAWVGFPHHAAASPPVTATGAFTFLNDTLTPIREADGNVFFNEVASISYTGDLAGVAAATDTLVVHSNGSINGHGTEVCSPCTIGGRTGSFTGFFSFHGSGGQITGHETFTAGSGGLVGLHGGGTFEGSPAGNTYSFTYRFSPQ